MGKISAIGRMAFGIAVLGWLVFGSAGCTRVYYRRQADNEVADILKEKDQYPRWKIEQMHVYPDPRALCRSDRSGPSEDAAGRRGGLADVAASAAARATPAWAASAARLTWR